VQPAKIIMNIKNKLKTVDFERIVYVPVYITMAFMGFIEIYFDILTKPLPWNLPTFFSMFEKMLIVTSYLLGVIFFVVRRRAFAKTRHFWPKAAAYITPFLPLIFVFDKNEISMAPTLFPLFLLDAGILFTLYSLMTLGRSFSIAPQVRVLVRSGPYRFIRHPMYVGEIVAFTGVLIVGLSVLRLFAFLLLVFIQTYRAFEEERLLEERLPNYSSYKRATKRFIPGLI
jgi:protein-S-isoprenylcysteine O-methyltransferase Ste14